MKPDWKDAPYWAEYRAMDGDGVWRWWEFQPETNFLDWPGEWCKGGRTELCCMPETIWYESLEKRP